MYGKAVRLSPRPSCASRCSCEVVADDCFALVRRLRHWNIAHAITSAANRGMVVARPMRTEVFDEDDDEDGGDNDDDNEDDEDDNEDNEDNEDDVDDMDDVDDVDDVVDVDEDDVEFGTGVLGTAPCVFGAAPCVFGAAPGVFGVATISRPITIQIAHCSNSPETGTVNTNSVVIVLVIS